MAAVSVEDLGGPLPRRRADEVVKAFDPPKAGIRAPLRAKPRLRRTVSVFPPRRNQAQPYAIGCLGELLTTPVPRSIALTANRELATPLRKSRPSGYTMRHKLRAAIADEARRDAIAYYREHRHAVGSEAEDWVVQAWADVRRDFKLSDAEVVEAWPLYWGTLSKETERRAASRAPDR